MKTGIIIIDPGYDGMADVGGSTTDYTASALRNVIKNLTLSTGNFFVEKLKSKIHYVYLFRDSDNVSSFILK